MENKDKVVEVKESNEVIEKVSMNELTKAQLKKLPVVTVSVELVGKEKNFPRVTFIFPKFNDQKEVVDELAVTPKLESFGITEYKLLTALRKLDNQELKHYFGTPARFYEGETEHGKYYRVEVMFAKHFVRTFFFRPTEIRFANVLGLELPFVKEDNKSVNRTYSDHVANMDLNDIVSI